MEKRMKNQWSSALQDREQADFLFGLPVCEASYALFITELAMCQLFLFTYLPPTPAVTEPKPCKLKLMTIFWYVGVEEEKNSGF